MEPEVWRWIWLGTAAAFVAGEIALTGSFFLLPFGAGAAAATVVAFTGAEAAWQWLAFVVVSAAAFAALRPLARRMASGGNPVGVGAGRLVGETGVVTDAPDLAGGRLATVRIGREDWHAEDDDGAQLSVGEPIEVVRIEGTRAVVRRTT
ncbi:MAG: NfeD family protein [Actinomycetota bacterium]|nr:NfeD family protein [Actinomycetota bacterium]MEE2958740.1 NfeD family protein [Actinomycetota bacterium]